MTTELSVVEEFDWNVVILSLVRTLVGNISANMHAVGLDWTVAPGGIDARLTFVLYEESEEDREEIEYIGFEFLAATPYPIEVEEAVIVDNDPPADLGLPGIIVFRRKSD